MLTHTMKSNEQDRTWGVICDGRDYQVDRTLKEQPILVEIGNRIGLKLLHLCGRVKKMNRI